MTAGGRHRRCTNGYGERGIPIGTSLPNDGTDVNVVDFAAGSNLAATDTARFDNVLTG